MAQRGGRVPSKDAENKVTARVPKLVSTRTNPRLESQENPVAAARVRVKTATMAPQLIPKARRALTDVGNSQTSEANVPKKNVQDKNVRLITTKPPAARNALKIQNKNGVLAQKTTTQTASVTVKPFSGSANVGAKEPKKELATINEAPLQNAQKLNMLPNKVNVKSHDFGLYYDINDPQLVSCYVDDIFDYLRTLEIDRIDVLQVDFLNGHRSNPRIRQVLVDWIVSVHIDFKLALETLYITVSLVDEYLSKHKEVGKDSLQLVGVSALFIATKHEEVYPPDVEEMVYICDRAFSKQQIYSMEADILKTIDFRVNYPLPIHFLRRYNQIICASEEHHSMGKYLMEISMVNYNTCRIRPSLLAAAACCIANMVVGRIETARDGWSELLAYFSRYTYDNLKPIILQIAKVLEVNQESKEKAVLNKYSKSKFNKVSLHPHLNYSFIKKLVNTP